MRALKLLFVLALLCVGAIATDGWRALNQSITPPQLPATFELERGQSWQAFVRRMRDQGWLEHSRDAFYLRAWGRLDGQARRIHSGEYRLDEAVTLSELMDMLVAGRVVQYDITFIEGWRLSEALEALRRHEAVRHTLPESAGEADAALRDALEIDAESAEGWFLPETYRFPRGTADLSILKRAHAAMQRALSDAWDARRDDLPIDSPAELLTLASIVEKETGAVAERARVAGVFKRRLDRGMRLQTDPTVLYGRDPERSGRLRRVDLVTDTPYNTYTRGGLPPTPICLPGRAALNATAQPAEGTALYFVSRNDGTHVFSDTLIEHNRAVDRYQRGGGQ
ncbi:endolytic transglycosylase MltG [Algiphilus aromaticivorans]|uniref:endolytic transglycosylase MltG n=1 Tax=Algiphilus aromaticivorans TaxID=382454 RepID=UPI0005C17710|nr:endolytic transglycosylase MltG [Algiphilus aromaticivorans]